MTGTEIETVGEIADVMIKQKKRGRLAVKPGALSNTVRLAAHVSNGSKSRIRPVVGRI